MYFSFKNVVALSLLALFFRISATSAPKLPIRVAGLIAKIPIVLGVFVAERRRVAW